ncbi:11892_t:CDS:1, partial [Funneliformis geosporum]
MSTEIYNKIYDFLTTAEERRINATSVIYLGMKENRWISQTELKMTVERAVASASNAFIEGSPRQLRIFRILPQ